MQNYKGIKIWLLILFLNAARVNIATFLNIVKDFDFSQNMLLHTLRFNINFTYKKIQCAWCSICITFWQRRDQMKWWSEYKMHIQTHTTLCISIYIYYLFIYAFQTKLYKLYYYQGRSFGGRWDGRPTLARHRPPQGGGQ